MGLWAIVAFTFTLTLALFLLPPPSGNVNFYQGAEFTSLAAHTLSLSRLANHGPAKQPRDRGLIVIVTIGQPSNPRPRVDCHHWPAGGAPRQLPSLFQAPRQLSSLFQAPRQLSMSSLLQACHAPSLLQALRGLSSLLQAPRQSCHPRQSAPSPRVSALPRLQSFPRLQPFHPLCSAPHPLRSALRSRLSQAPFVLRCWLWLPTNTIKGM